MFVRDFGAYAYTYVAWMSFVKINMYISNNVHAIRIYRQTSLL